MKIGLIAGMVGFTLLAGALGFSPLGQASLLVAILFGVGVVIHWVAGLRRPQDPYSLALLKQIQEREDDRIDEEELNAYDTSGNVICTNCGSEYDSRLGLCPRCKKSQF